MGAVAFALTVWLVFFTPGTSVSAAERLWRALAALVAPEPTPAPRPPAGPARQRDITLPAPPTAARAGAVAGAGRADAEPAGGARNRRAHRAPRPARAGGAAHPGDADADQRGRRRTGRRTGPRRNRARAARGAAWRGPARDAVDAGGSARHARRGRATGGAAGTSTLRAVTLDRNAVPAADDLRRALASRGALAAAAGSPAGISRPRSIASRTTACATRARRFSKRRRCGRWRSASTRRARPGLPDITPAKWRALLAAQAERVACAVDQVRTQLEPCSCRAASRPRPRRDAGSSPMPSAAFTRIAAEQHLGDAARRIADDLGQVERAARAALAVAETAPATIELRDATFWRRLAATRDRIAAFTRTRQLRDNAWTRAPLAAPCRHPMRDLRILVPPRRARLERTCNSAPAMARGAFRSCSSG